MTDDRNDDRFWAKVDKTDSCWVWKASTSVHGVAQFRVGRKMVAAHRHAWELINGAPPSGLLRHACGNLGCVRPDHMLAQQRRRGPTSLARPPAVRFRAQVQVGRGCWLWRGSTDWTGFGQFRDYDLDTQRPARNLRAHRYAWELENGPIPPGVEVAQLCGNRLCVRPDHLTLLDAARQLTEPTPRQLEVLRRLAQLGTGYGSLRTVATELGLKHQTVNSLVYELRKRLGVSTTEEAVTWLKNSEPALVTNSSDDARYHGASKASPARRRTAAG